MSEKDEKKDIFSSATEGSDSESSKKIEKEMLKNKKAKYWISGCVIAILVIGGGAIGLNAIHHNNPSVKSEKSTSTISKDDLAKAKKQANALDKSNFDKKSTDDDESADSAPSTDIPAFASRPFNSYKSDSDKAKLLKDVTTYAGNTSVINMTGDMPSTDNGYTSDTSKATNSDGTINDKYSYQTKENLDYNFGLYLQRFINPIFGAWNGVVTGDKGALNAGFPDESFKDMFTDEWWQANVKDDDHSKIPIMADWNGDKWGGMEILPKDGIIWVPTITSIEGETNTYSDPDGEPGNEAGLALSSHTKIDFTATTKDGKTHVKHGDLYMKLIPNTRDKAIEKRNIISEASLTFSN